MPNQGAVAVVFSSETARRTLLSFVSCHASDSESESGTHCHIPALPDGVLQAHELLIRASEANQAQPGSDRAPRM